MHELMECVHSTISQLEGAPLNPCMFWGCRRVVGMHIGTAHVVGHLVSRCQTLFLAYSDLANVGELTDDFSLCLFGELEARG